MEIQAKSADRNLLLEFCGELDHHGARGALREVELAIDAALPRMLVMDFAGVTFMDSSGIGIIAGRYKKIQCLDGKVFILNAGKQVKRILLLSGIQKYVIFMKS